MPSKALEKYLSNYSGVDDPHLVALRLIKEKFEVYRVLYPGSWVHLTPSLLFSYVVYVDFFAEMESMFGDAELLHYIKTNSETIASQLSNFIKQIIERGLKRNLRVYQQIQREKLMRKVYLKMKRNI